MNPWKFLGLHHLDFIGALLFNGYFISWQEGCILYIYYIIMYIYNIYV